MIGDYSKQKAFCPNHSSSTQKMPFFVSLWVSDADYPVQLCPPPLSPKRRDLTIHSWKSTGHIYNKSWIAEKFVDLIVLQFIFFVRLGSFRSH